jgi:hypothetical protein
MVDLRHQAGIDLDGRDVAVAIECGAGDTEVDVGGKDDVDDRVGAVGWVGAVEGRAG